MDLQTMIQCAIIMVWNVLYWFSDPQNTVDCTDKPVGTVCGFNAGCNGNGECISHASVCSGIDGYDFTFCIKIWSQQMKVLIIVLMSSVSLMPAMK